MDVAVRLGVLKKEKDGTQSCLCVFHEDRTPSMIIMSGVNRFECKSCGEKGDVFDLAKKVLNTDLTGVLKWLGEDIADEIKPEEYLISRGITEKTAQELGLSLVKHNEKWAVKIPLKKGNKYRYVTPGIDGVRYGADKGTVVQMFKTRPAKKQVIVTEGEFDSIIGWQETGFPFWSSTAGAGKLSTLVSEFHGMERILMIPDKDKAGREAIVENAEVLGADRLWVLELPFGKDLTEYFLRGGTKESFTELLKEAKPFVDWIKPRVKFYSDFNDTEIEEIPSWDGLSVGDYELDREFGFPQAFYIIIGNAGAGKSWFSLWLARMAWELNKKRTVFFSLEMSEPEVRKRLLQAWSDITQKDMEAGAPTDKAKKLLREDAIVVDEFFPEESEKRNEQELERAVKYYYQKGYRVFILDHFHELPNTEDNEKIQKTAKTWAHAIRGIVNEYKDIWFFLFAQPHGAAEKKQLLTRGDFKGAKNITDMCQIFMSLNRKQAKDEDTGTMVVDDSSRLVLLRVDKSRRTSVSYKNYKLVFSETGNFHSVSVYDRPQQYNTSVDIEYSEDGMPF